jgi:hypothetical protein
MTAAVATPVGRNERMSTSLHLPLVGSECGSNTTFSTAASRDKTTEPNSPAIMMIMG